VNRRVIGGLAASSEFVPLVPKIAALADKVPSWPELGYLAAWIADKANASEQALKYYQRAVAVFASAKNTAVVDAINVRISALTPAPAEPSATRASIPEQDCRMVLTRFDGMERWRKASGLTRRGNTMSSLRPVSTTRNDSISIP
jgi:hypothetical protein